MTAPGPGAFQPVTPLRVLTTQQSSAGKIRAGETRIITVAQVPANATAVAISVTAIKGTAAGYLKVFPGGEAQPVSSTVSFNAGQIIANYATIKLGAGRKLAIFNKFGAVDVNIDLQGYYLPPLTGPAAFVGYANVLVSGSLDSSFSSEGSAVTVTKGVPGSYVVTFTGLPATTALSGVQVTPNITAGGGIVCSAGRSSANSFSVNCRDTASGQRLDAPFTLTVMA